MCGKTHVGLLLDLSAKDTAVELMHINMHSALGSRMEIMRVRLSNAVPLYK